MQNSKKKKLIKNIIFFIIIFPPFFFVLQIYLEDKYFDVSPHLSEQTVLSLCDNLSNLAITGNSNFKDNRFHLVFCDNQNKSGCFYNLFRNKAIAYIQYKNIFSMPVDFYRIKFYYDTIDNCTKYYEISYNPKLNKALCIDGQISRRNPFSAKIIMTNK
ncbi:hypothetical protein [Mucispirillum schaedleri]|uniref:hypothetical protein n=1 Tax=Mucispirillum schaedleri TaxID=248039 RepID=UPI001F59989F|nr:hypothetical protein [Mucispirillum schaedleri]